MLLLGRLSDKFGRRPFVLTATVTSIVGAIIAATAKDMNTLIGANVRQRSYVEHCVLMCCPGTAWIGCWRSIFVRAARGGNCAQQVQMAGYHDRHHT
jgi:MFS family permease